MTNLILINVTAKQILAYMNANYKATKGSEFTYSDVCGYIKRGKTPRWYGNFRIERNEQFENVKLFNLIYIFV